MASDCKKECDAPFCEEITVTKVEVEESCNEAWDQRGSAAPEYVSLPKVEIKIEEPCDDDSDSNDTKGEPTHPEDVYDCVFCDEQIAGEASYRRHVGACGKR